MKLPGLLEYSYYQEFINTPQRRDSWDYIGRPVVTKYPLYVSILRFESLAAFENYENSPELISLRRAMTLEVAKDFSS
jgi:hypothetical protein